MVFGNVALVTFTVLLMQLVAALSWAVGLWALELPRRPSAFWCAAGLLSAGSMALVMSRGGPVPLWLNVPLSNLLLVGSTLAFTAGLRSFLDLAPGDREAKLALGLQVLTGIAFAALPDGDGRMAVIAGVTSAIVLSIFLSGARDGLRTLRREFNPRAARVLMLPLVLMCAMVFMRLAGVLRTGSAEAMHVDTPAHVAMALVYLVAMSALHLSMAAMVVMRLVASLRRLSSRDTLTGLANRGEWMNQLALQHRWLGRFGQPFSVLMLDLDHFKRVNDSWGHPAGDAVLVGTAQLMTATLRGIDVPGRLGGEEFAVLLPGTNATQAATVAERLRAAIEATQLDWRDHPIAVTVSIGVATADDAAEPVADLIERADAALYAAKHGGRNRVVAAPGEPVAYALRA